MPSTRLRNDPERPPTVRLVDPAGLPDMLLYRLNRLRAVGGGVVLRLCEGRFGVTRREWVLLALLRQAEPITSSGLARQAELDKPATSKAIVSLVAKKLVRRAPRDGDHRYVELALTDAGHALFDAMMPVMRDINAGILDALDAREVALLDGLLDRLQASVDRIADGMEPWPAADRRHGGTRRAAPTPDVDAADRTAEPRRTPAGRSSRRGPAG